jgi:hypothetical protein
MHLFASLFKKLNSKLIENSSNYYFRRLVVRLTGPPVMGSSVFVTLGVSGALTVPSEPATVFLLLLFAAVTPACFSSGVLRGKSKAVIGLTPLSAAIKASVVCGLLGNGASSSAGRGQVVELRLKMRSLARTLAFRF